MCHFAKFLYETYHLILVVNEMKIRIKKVEVLGLLFGGVFCGFALLWFGGFGGVFSLFFLLWFGGFVCSVLVLRFLVGEVVLLFCFVLWWFLIVGVFLGICLFVCFLETT